MVESSLGEARLVKGSAGSSRATLYNQLADILREKIYAHEWGVRSKIPSEHELMELFGVARGTVRRALKTLVDEGLLVQQHGRGTFVAEPGLSHPGGTRPFSRSPRRSPSAAGPSSRASWTRSSWTPRRASPTSSR